MIGNFRKEMDEKYLINKELNRMSFEDIVKLRGSVGAKIYDVGVLGAPLKTPQSKGGKKYFKRLNKNRPCEKVANKKEFSQFYLGPRIPLNSDPRFDYRSGKYKTDVFKKNYHFLNALRKEEITEIKRNMLGQNCTEKHRLKMEMEKLINKNLNDKKWHEMQELLMEERKAIQKARSCGKQPIYTTKKEWRAKILVKQYEYLKSKGTLNKYLEKKRKKNVVKDRKKVSCL